MSALVRATAARITAVGVMTVTTNILQYKQIFIYIHYFVLRKNGAIGVAERDSWFSKKYNINILSTPFPKQCKG